MLKTVLILSLQISLNQTKSRSHYFDPKSQIINCRLLKTEFDENVRKFYKTLWEMEKLLKMRNV